MKTIHKYQLEHRDRQDLSLPAPGEIISCVVQGTQLVVYAVVDTLSEDIVITTVHVYGTGHPLAASPGAFLCTVVDGSFVWHVYLERSKRV